MFLRGLDKRLYIPGLNLIVSSLVVGQVMHGRPFAITLSSIDLKIPSKLHKVAGLFRTILNFFQIRRSTSS
jgi:hypothetical protein